LKRIKSERGKDSTGLKEETGRQTGEEKAREEKWEKGSDR